MSIPMLRFYLAVLALVSLNFLSAQKTEFETVLVVPESDKTSNRLIYIFDLGESYVLWNKRKTSKEKIFFIDKATGEIHNSGSAKSLLGKPANEIGVLNNHLVILGYEDQHALYVQGENPVDASYVIYASYNPKGGLVKSGTLFKESSDEKELRTSISASFDSKGKYLVVNSKKVIDFATANTSFFNAQLELIAQDEVKFEEEDMASRVALDQSYSSIITDDQDNIYSLSYNRSSIRIARSLDNFATIEIAISGEELGVGEFLSELQLDHLGSDTILFTALILKQGKSIFKGKEVSYVKSFYDLQGVHQMLISSYDHELISENSYYFTEEQKQQWPESIATLQYKRVLNRYQNFEKRVLVLGNGNYIVISELQNAVGNSLAQDFLTISCFHTSGELRWTKVVDKFQISFMYGDYYYKWHDFSSDSSLISGNQLKTIFNQRIGYKNAEDYDGCTLASEKQLKKAQQKIINLDLKTGEIISQEISSYEDTQARFFKPRFSDEAFPTGPYMVIRDFELDRDVVVKLKQ